MDHDLSILKDIITAAARSVLLPRFTHVERQHKADGSVVSEADLLTQQYIYDAVREYRPEIGFLAEEMSGDEQQRLLSSGRPIWCLDPLDGSRNYVAGIPHFSISLALLDQGQVQLGIVYDPVRDECFSAYRGVGSWLNDERIIRKNEDITLQQSTGLIDFKRLPIELSTRLVENMPYASQRSFGSTALDWCWMAVGRCHVYLHGQANIWDYAAGHLVFQEAGGQSVTLEGKDLPVNSLEPTAAVAALDPDLFDTWVEWLGIKITR